MPFHQNSLYAAGLLEGAREQGKYWELMDVFFARQVEWASHQAPRPDLRERYTQGLGLDLPRLGATGAGAETRQRIKQDEDADDGAALGVTRTPTFFVNGKPLPQIGYEPLRAALAAGLR